MGVGTKIRPRSLPAKAEEPGAAAGMDVGAIEGRHLPQVVARVVATSNPPPASGQTYDDAERKERTQAYVYEYNSKGRVTRSTDPRGRETRFVYDTNEIDLLEVKQWNAYSCQGEHGSQGKVNRDSSQAERSSV
jgi:RHS Repeat